MIVRSLGSDSEDVGEVIGKYGRIRKMIRTMLRQRDFNKI